jgi:hypothetical protein
MVFIIFRVEPGVSNSSLVFIIFPLHLRLSKQQLCIHSLWVTQSLFPIKLVPSEEQPARASLISRHLDHYLCCVFVHQYIYAVALLMFIGESAKSERHACANDA